MTSASSDDPIPVRNSGIGLCSDGITFKHITMHEVEGRHMIPVRNSREFRAIPESEPIPGILESVGIPGIPYNSVSIRFPEFLTGIGLCSDGIIFKHITTHEVEGRRVIPVRNSEIGCMCL
jgi:hypothetical protein